MDTQNPESVQGAARGQEENSLAGSQLAQASAAATLGSCTSEPAARGFLEIVFRGPRGIRSGWRLCMWTIGAGIAAFVFGGLAAMLVRRVPAETQPLGLIFGDGIPFVGVLAATILMSRIEHRTLADYAVLVPEAFGSQFWQGALWGLASVSTLLGGIHLCNGFELGSVALSGSRLAEDAVLWAIA